MSRTTVFWILAIIITLASAVYQRLTGPSYPVKGKAVVHGSQLSYTFERSCVTSSDLPVKVVTSDTSLKGAVNWKRYKSFDEWAVLPMVYKDGALQAELPRQPQAGKIVYSVQVMDGAEVTPLTRQPIVARFRGDVPPYILIPHVLCMFLMMLWSTRTGFEAFARVPDYRKYTVLTLIFLFLGGMVLGPITQKFAFGAYWTGFPYGHDLTDNKTFIALIAWLIAAWPVMKGKNPRYWVLAAAVITLLVFLIPHSMFGSELDYTKK